MPAVVFLAWRIVINDHAVTCIANSLKHLGARLLGLPAQSLGPSTLIKTLHDARMFEKKAVFLCWGDYQSWPDGEGEERERKKERGRKEKEKESKKKRRERGREREEERKRKKRGERKEKEGEREREREREGGAIFSKKIFVGFDKLPKVGSPDHAPGSLGTPRLGWN